jgi:hypothetical protein
MPSLAGFPAPLKGTLVHRLNKGIRECELRIRCGMVSGNEAPQMHVPRNFLLHDFLSHPSVAEGIDMYALRILVDENARLSDFWERQMFRHLIIVESPAAGGR